MTKNKLSFYYSCDRPNDLIQTNTDGNRIKQVLCNLLNNALKFTKEGKFAEIDKNSLLYVRIKEQREEPICQEEYYYSIR